jgi:hypothetical protein
LKNPAASSLCSFSFSEEVSFIFFLLRNLIPYFTTPQCRRWPYGYREESRKDFRVFQTAWAREVIYQPPLLAPFSGPEDTDENPVGSLMEHMGQDYAAQTTS